VFALACAISPSIQRWDITRQEDLAGGGHKTDRYYLLMKSPSAWIAARESHARLAFFSLNPWIRGGSLAASVVPTRIVIVVAVHNRHLPLSSSPPESHAAVLAAGRSLLS
jgi:hypothetical protein